MTPDQIAILLVLLATMALFLWGRWRHDMVAMAALLVCVFTGLVAAEDAFSGFGHPAVITVACVLVLSRGLQTTGAVDALAQRVVPTASGPTLTIAVLTGLGTVLSAFMNNVGAMALLMPLAVQLSGKLQLPPGKVLMPLAFGTILGGMTTLIGTPPNLIVSGFRGTSGGSGFGMFDFTPVGLAVALVGVVFVAWLGWRIVPAREQKGAESFDTGTYLTEALVGEDSAAAGMTLREAERTLEQAEAQVIGMVRNGFRVHAPSRARRLYPGDILVIEVEPESLPSALSSLGLTFAEQDTADASGETDAAPQPAAGGSADTGDQGDERQSEEGDSDEVVLQELVVMPTSPLLGRPACDRQLCSRFGLNLLAVSRQGRRSVRRVRSMSAQPGDVLLLQGAPEALAGFASAFNCVPLAKRSIHIPNKGRATLATAVMAAAIGGAAFGLLPAAIAFAAAVLLFALWRILPLREVYEAIDWPVVVLLAALLPVAGAMASTGAADLLAQALLDHVAQGRPVVALAVVLVVSMTLSDFMNNAATAAVMCPIALSGAAQLGANSDPFLMAVAIGASCAFLTPIGHQNNTLILGPGGFGFGDYWRLGLPMELLVVAVSVPMLLWVWPL